MCKAWDDHEARAKEIGKEIGEAKTLLDVISNLQKNMSCSLEHALLMIGKTLGDYENAKRLLECD